MILIYNGTKILDRSKEEPVADIFELLNRISRENEKRESKPISFIVAGLGNPGAKYTFTRHNTGFLAVDYMSQKLGFECGKLKFKALCGEAEVEGVRVLFMKPETFMNLSGEAVRAAADFYKIPPERVLIISDDVSLPVGKVRIRAKGSDGGQKGIRSVTQQLGTDKFPRIKIGVGEKPSPEWDMADWVLSSFSDADKKTIFDAFGRVTEAVGYIVSGQLETAQSKCNG